MKKDKVSIGAIISTILLVISVGLLLYNLYPQWANKRQVEKLQEESKPSPSPTASPTPSPSPTPTVLPSEEVEEEKIIKPYFVEQIKKYDNEDIVAYLQIPDTSVEYLVVQKENDNTYYLDHDIENKPNQAGWIYMDYENDILGEDKNTVIYGHNMRQDYMFHSLRYYRDEAYFKDHRYIYLNTLYDETKWEIFSAYITTTDFYYIQVSFVEDEFENLIAEMKNKSFYNTGVEISKDDRILTLSTCTGRADDERYVINAKLVEVNGEKYQNDDLSTTTPLDKQ